MSEKQRYCIHCMEPLPESATICAHCHFDYADRQENPSHLPHTVLAGKYLVGQAIGQGGFGITYIGLDLNLQIKVAIKEYFPMGFASRTATSDRSVIPNTERDAAFFSHGREKFIKEAQVLAKLNTCTAIVHVRDYFQEHGTAYIVMDFVEGKTLLNHIRESNGKMSFIETYQLLASPLWSSCQRYISSALSIVTSARITSSSRRMGGQFCWTLARRGPSKTTGRSIRFQLI